MTSSPSFLFVCTGNICRSPLAELAMRQEAERRGLSLDIDSAGTGNWHVGAPPDHRSRAIAEKHGLTTRGQHARQVKPEDFDRFTHIVALDRSHLKALKRLKPAHSQAELVLMLDDVPGRKGDDVADPYYGTPEDFETTWQDVTAGCAALARKVLD
ncbi:low molecular weight phosphotyrosine protein phosphatase [Oecophyllibacter saccharovorans]|uniref:low molecular weight protein-tyrosine-phosphatase n=1 Tax=Oecophyllibacter saccharovorans TaxID=2558360 RepID=UPI001143ADDE|nr:low molecular weight protein-tyrosine-phosphatase [Oecophyllibacter saccharovorans]QDH14833.1 low molecular weight phosphotyrosine protein phosphatase [Oecophyllibacter saccharovorans]